MRRATPSTHHVFGIPQTINSATYQVVDVIARTRSLGSSESLDAVIGKMESTFWLWRIWLSAFTEEIKNLLIGQGHDLLWVNERSVPAVEEYLRMVDGS